MKDSAKKGKSGGSGGEDKPKEGRKKQQDEDGKDTSKVPTDPDVEPADDGNDPQVKLAMPFTLKKQLVDDWEMVTREPHQLVPLPRTPSAATILAAFLEQKKEKSGTSALQLRRFQELMEGIRMYFDKALPLILLYRHEREQYEAMKAQYTAGAAAGSAGESKDAGTGVFKPSEVYGAEHLLRLFVRLPHLLAQTAMSAQEVTQVRNVCT